MLLAYHLVFRDFFPLPNGRMGHDYVLTLGSFLDGYLWFRNNGILTPPWFTPSFCGGQAFFADPQSIFYSIPQFLAFLVDPLQAAYASFLLFAALGFWGMFLFSRRNFLLDHSASLVAATVFMFNGFYAHRIIVGHYGYQSFMLIPFVAYFLLKSPSNKLFSIGSIRQSLIAGALVAYWFHSGLTTLMVPAALAVISLACMTALITKRHLAGSFLIRGLCAGLFAVGLSASKLNANMALMESFARDYYPLPGISDIGGLLTFVFQSLFYSSEHVYQTVIPLWKNMQWAAMPHELAFGLTPISLLVLLVGAGSFAYSKQQADTQQPGASSSRWLPGVVLSAILLLPLALLYYTPDWNETLKRLPLVGSTTSPYRWLIIYIPLLAALTGLATGVSGKLQKGMVLITIIGIPFLNNLENRDYYQRQDFNPAPIINYYQAVEGGVLVPRITKVADLKAENGQPFIDNGLFIQGISPMRCYNPLYGYRLEKLVTAPLIPGSIEAESSANSLNLHNPACLLFPGENNCRPWDAFQKSQVEELRNFASYRPYSFEKSGTQHVADLVTLLSLCILSLLLLGLTYQYLSSLTHAMGSITIRAMLSAFISSPISLTLVSIAITWLAVFLITRWVSPNGLTTEALEMIKKTFLPHPQFFQPEPRERTAYLLSITLFPAISILLTVFLYRTSSVPEVFNPVNINQKRMKTIGSWLLFILIFAVALAAREAPFGRPFGFSEYMPVIALSDNSAPLTFAIIFLVTFFFYYWHARPESKILNKRYRLYMDRALDLGAIGLILFITARITFIPEDTGGLAWAPDLVHMAPLFETAAAAYLTNATVGADLISQYGGLVEFAQPLLWFLGGDPLALMWFTFLALSTACLAQWLAVRKVTGNALISLMAIGGIFYLTGIKFITFTCFQCFHFRWLWPSVFLCLAAFYSSRSRYPYLPYFLFPIAIYWNPETGLASAAAWIGWKIIANAVPVAVSAAWRSGIRSLATSAIAPAIATSTGVLLIVLYIAAKSGQLPDPSMMSRFAKDFYIYGFFMLPMPGLHLWNIFAAIAGVLLVLGIQYYGKRSLPNPDDTKHGFIVYAALLFSLLFAYYQGRSFYGALLAVSYPLWLAIVVWLHCFRDKLIATKEVLISQPLRTFGIGLICLGFAASLTTNFYLRPTINPFNKQNIAEKAELQSWVEKTSGGRTPLFISFSAWRLALLTRTQHANGIIPLTALLRRDQLDNYLSELENPKYALYYDLTNDIYFVNENTSFTNELKQQIRNITGNRGETVPVFENNQGKLILLNPTH